MNTIEKLEKLLAEAEKDRTENHIPLIDNWDLAESSLEALPKLLRLARAALAEQNAIDALQDAIDQGQYGPDADEDKLVLTARRLNKNVERREQERKEALSELTKETT